MSSRNNSARIAIVMGSKSDWATMQFTAEILDALNVPYHVEVVSAHRTPDKLFSFAEGAEENGFQVIIAGAGGAAHLPGMLAAKTLVPVLGVPVASRHLQGVDSLHSIVQMPKGVPVATFAIGAAGAANAALFAVAMLAGDDAAVEIEVRIAERLGQVRRHRIADVETQIRLPLFGLERTDQGVELREQRRVGQRDLFGLHALRGEELAELQTTVLLGEIGGVGAEQREGGKRESRLQDGTAGGLGFDQNGGHGLAPWNSVGFMSSMHFGTLAEERAKSMPCRRRPADLPTSNCRQR
mgnify:CR=1 FL=1